MKNKTQDEILLEGKVKREEHQCQWKSENDSSPAEFSFPSLKLSPMSFMFTFEVSNPVMSDWYQNFYPVLTWALNQRRR